MLRLRLLPALAVVALATPMGQVNAWEGPIEKMVETREGERREAAAQGEDPVDALFAPGDDAFTDWNKDMNQGSNPDNATIGGSDDKK